MIMTIAFVVLMVLAAFAGLILSTCFLNRVARRRKGPAIYYLREKR